MKELSKFNIDYKYLCGRDNYTCQNCNEELEQTQVFVRKIKESGKNDETNLSIVCEVCNTQESLLLKQPLREFSGRLIAITGPMFSQKSTTTRALYNKYRAFAKNITPTPFVWVKPLIDSRKEGYTQTHDSDLFEALTVRADRPDLSLDILGKFSIIAFDEVQFFSERILHVIHELLKKGCLIIINGLKLTADRRFFGTMHYLLAEADEIHSLKAVCNVCELVDYATRTKSFDANKPSVSIGGNEQYYAVCPTCDGGTNEEKFLKRTFQKE